MKKRTENILSVIAFLAIVAIIVIILIATNSKMETKQQEYEEFEHEEDLTLVIPSETNIRTYHITGKENIDTIISFNREYDWHLKLSRYYSIEDYAGRTWYGIPADGIEQGNAPRAVRKWCKNNPDLIFWVCVAGGVSAIMAK